MVNITRIEFEVTPWTYTEEQRASLREKGMSDETIDSYAWLNGASDSKRTPESGNKIVEWVNKKEGVDLKFLEWNCNNIIVGPNGRRTRDYRIIGGWSGHTYILRGLIKRRAKSGKFSWLCNGQAATGSIQVAHWAEQEQLIFTGIEKVEEEFLRNFIKNFNEKKGKDLTIPLEPA